MSGQYDGNGDDWASWKRLLVEQIKELRADVKRLEERQNIHWTEIALIKAKIAIYAAVISIAGSAAVNWVVKAIGDL